jgi:hypothetical protein
MRTIMVRYRTEDAHASTNASLIRAVFDELRARAPNGFRYATYRIEGGATFMHVATTEGDGDAPVTSLASFKKFQAELQGRCVEPPVVTELSPIDSYDSRLR